MTRGRTIALVILALVVATVMAMGPVRVWDALTLRTMERPWVHAVSVARLWPGDDVVTCRYRVPRWSDGEDHLPRGVPLQGWHENGQLAIEVYVPSQGPGYRRVWSRDGELTTNMLLHDGYPHVGILTAWPGGAPSRKAQVRSDGGKNAAEARASPPWFTEEEILQSVEGVEE